MNEKLMKLECKCYMDLRTKSGVKCTEFDTTKMGSDHDRVDCIKKKYSTAEGLVSILRGDPIQRRLG